jgi:hypothetical protein
MASVECLGEIVSCPPIEAAGAFQIAPVQSVGPIDAILIPPDPATPFVPTGLVLDPPAGQFVVYLLTGSWFLLDTVGPFLAAETVTGYLGFSADPGSPDARLIAFVSPANTTLAVDPSGAVLISFNDVLGKPQSFRAYLQASAPQLMPLP